MIKYVTEVLEICLLKKFNLVNYVIKADNKVLQQDIWEIQFD